MCTLPKTHNDPWGARSGISRWKVCDYLMRRRLDDEEPWDRFIPQTTGQFCRGSCSPCSTLSAQTPDKWTLIVERCKNLARKVANRHRVHSSVGQGGSEGWSWLSLRKKLKNFLWAVAYFLRVNGVRPCIRKARHCCSREKLVNSDRSWGRTGVRVGWAPGANCRNSCQRKRERASAILY